MRLCEVTPETVVGAYDPMTGDYVSLGSGFMDSGEARLAAEDEFDSEEYLLVAELGTVGRLESERAESSA